MTRAVGVQVVGEVVVSADQRGALLEFVKKNPGVGIAHALREVGVAGTKGQLRDFVQNDLELQDDLLEARGEKLRTELMKRAVDGAVEIVVLPSGERVERVVKSDRLLEFACRMYLPEAKVLRTGYVEHAGDGGGPVQVEVRHDHGDILRRLEQAGVLRRGHDGDADAAAAVGPGRPALLPARTD